MNAKRYIKRQVFKQAQTVKKSILIYILIFAVLVTAVLGYLLIVSENVKSGLENQNAKLQNEVQALKEEQILQAQMVEETLEGLYNACQQDIKQAFDKLRTEALMEARKEAKSEINRHFQTQALHVPNSLHDTDSRALIMPE